MRGCQHTAQEIQRLGSLQGAALDGHLEVLEILLAAGADVNAQGSYFNGYTALTAAAEAGNVKIVKRLLEVGSDKS